MVLDEIKNLYVLTNYFHLDLLNPSAAFGYLVYYPSVIV